MSDFTISSTNQTGFQQLGSLMAKRSAEQAQELAKNLRRQADVVQAIADQYEEKAQTLDNRADKAKVTSDELSSRLTLADAFKQGASTLSDTMNHAVVQSDTYTAQGMNSRNVTKIAVSGAYLDTTV